MYSLSDLCLLMYTPAITALAAVFPIFTRLYINCYICAVMHVMGVEIYLSFSLLLLLSCFLEFLLFWPRFFFQL